MLKIAEREKRKDEFQKILADEILFEDLVFKCTYESIEDAKEIIHKFSTFWAQSLIVQVTAPFSFKLLGDLYSLTGKSQIEHSKNSPFSCYLLVRNLITEEDFDHDGHPMKWDLKTVEEYEKPIKENTLWYYIQENDIKSFTALYESGGFDLSKTETEFNGYAFSIPGLSCYFGSLDIIKYLLLNNVFFDRNALKYAVCSGFEEIVEFMMLEEYSFNDYLADAIKWHQNKIGKWLYENCKNNSFKLTDCVFWFNSDMLLYFLDDIKWNINECDSWDRTCLHVAVEQNNTFLVRFLILRGINLDVKDALAHRAIDYLKTKEMKDILSAK